MKAVLSTVSSASVTVRDDDGTQRQVGAVHSPALLALVGAGRDDSPEAWETMVRKIAELRIFPAPPEAPETNAVAHVAEGTGQKMNWGSQRNYSLGDVGGSVLLVSQFTLMGATARGRRPSWTAAAPGDQAAPVIEKIAAGLRQRGITVETGEFGADMQVSSVNEGPFTVLVEVE